jgi:hypothetical protein
LYLDVTGYIDDLNVNGSIIRKTIVTTKTAASVSETVAFYYLGRNLHDD